MPYVNYLATRELIASHQPVELVTNGDFASAASWTEGTGWAIGAGLASAVAGSASDLEQDFPLTEGLSYKLIFTLSAVTGGSITPYVQNTAGTARSANGTYNETIIAGAGAIALELNKDGSFAGAVDNVSLQLGTNAYDLDFSVSALQPINHTPKAIHRALDNTPETFADDKQTSYTVTTKLIQRGSATWLQWMEFLNSVRENETFTFDAYGTSSVPQDVNTAMIDGDWQEIYIERDQWRISFKVDIL